MNFKNLKDYAKEKKVCYQTAYNRFNKGLIPNSYKDETGHIIIIKESNKNQEIFEKIENYWIENKLSIKILNDIKNILES